MCDWYRKKNETNPCVVSARKELLVGDYKGYRAHYRMAGIEKTIRTQSGSFDRDEQYMNKGLIEAFRG